jgi:hypothetical protein
LLHTEGGELISVPPELQRYRLDGRSSEFVDGSLGELPNFVRKVRTTATWDGRTLTLETEPFNESVDEKTGETRTGRGITSVLGFRLEANGQELVVERTGYRAQPPAVLHGRPYDRKDDLVYNTDVARYVRGDR